MSTPYYQVYVDGVSIYDPTQRNKLLINPVLRPSLEEAGSFDFTMDSSHDSYNAIIPYGSDIEVREDGKAIFYGRALPPTINAYRMKTYHCEGLIAFLNDIIIPPLSKYVVNVISELEVEGEENEVGFTDGEEEEEMVQRVMYMDEYLDWVFEKYNTLQTKASRKMTLRNVNFTVNPALPYDSDYKSALQIIREEILPYTGGYLYATKVSGSIVVDVIQSFRLSNQTIKAGVNLMEFSETQQGFYTAVIAKGGKRYNEWESEEEPVQLEVPVAMSQDIINRYGVICAYKYFPEATTSDELYSRCYAFLAAQQFSKMIVDVSALDLHILDDEYDRLNVGSLVQFESPIPGEGTVEMVVSEAEIHLDTGEKRVSLGEKDRNKLTQQWRTTEKISNSSNTNIKVDQSIQEGSTRPVSGGAVYEALAGADKWIHQIDGVTQETGTVNFVTFSGE